MTIPTLNQFWITLSLSLCDRSYSQNEILNPRKWKCRGRSSGVIVVSTIHKFSPSTGQKWGWPSTRKRVVRDTKRWLALKDENWSSIEPDMVVSVEDTQQPHQEPWSFSARIPVGLGTHVKFGHSVSLLSRKIPTWFFFKKLSYCLLFLHLGNLIWVFRML